MRRIKACCAQPWPTLATRAVSNDLVKKLFIIRRLATFNAFHAISSQALSFYMTQSVSVFKLYHDLQIGRQRLSIKGFDCCGIGSDNTD